MLRMSVSTTWPAKPAILRAISRLKPIITAMDTSITAMLSATEITAMRSMTPAFLPVPERAVRRAMKRAGSIAVRFYGILMQSNA